MGARSAENFLIYQLIFINNFLSNGRAQRGKFLIYQLIFKINSFFVEKKYYASIQFKKHSAAMRFLLVKLVFSARSPPFQKTFGRDAFYYCKTAFFCKIAPHFLIDFS